MRGISTVLAAPATSLDVAGRFLDPAGQPASNAFPLSQNLAGTDFCPTAATSGGDAWIVAWLKQGTGIFARRLLSEGASVRALNGFPPAASAYTCDSCAWNW